MDAPPLPFPLPPPEAILLKPRHLGVSALVQAGWRPYATPISLDAERRRLLNIDLTEPDVGFSRTPNEPLAAVAHVETDRAGRVTHFEITAAEPVDASRFADAIAPGLPPPRVGGGADAREWVWGPETGAELQVEDEPVRIWVCAERAYGDRFWGVVSIVRR